MLIANYFVFPKKIRWMYAGPLGPYVDAFADQLQQHGYARTTIRIKIRTIATFSHWLYHHNFHANEVSAKHLKRFLAHRKHCCSSHDDPTALQEIIAVVCKLNGTPISATTGALSDHDRVVEDFKQYLLKVRGLSPKSVAMHSQFVVHFLSERFSDHAIQFDQLTCSDITRFVQRHVHERSHSRAQQVVQALRAFLRYLHHHGDIASNLAACVPSVASWSLASLPRFLLPDQVERVLEYCDRTTSMGRRDYAMLLLLARLGLRAGEVAALTLDDINWHSGYFAVRNKGGRWTNMPLPQDVGKAIVDYLAHGRPSSNDRHVFIHGQAPRTGFASSSSISAVATCALNRAGINLPRGGAHLFRHSLATTMLRQGVSLAEIGELLRHQHLDTTRLYAKVDLQALRALVQPWPGSTP